MREASTQRERETDRLRKRGTETDRETESRGRDRDRVSELLVNAFSLVGTCIELERVV